jgi:ABC-type multidrug transport system ATPase subunit
VLKEIVSRLQFLINVGLDYLSLDRSAETLSGGEAQRIRLASQIGSGLTGVMYVLDEPSIGLHQRDNERLLKTLKQLRDIGNTVIVVEHDEEAIRSADYVVDIGPGAGVHGGFVVAEGTPAAGHRQPGVTDRRLPGRPPAHRHARPAAPARSSPPAADRRRTRQQPEERHGRHPGRPVHLHHRRFRLGQVDADQRHALCSGPAAPLRIDRPSPPSTTASSASTISTR